MLDLSVKPFSVIIPLIPTHDVDFRQLLRYLSRESDLIQEIIICRSETKLTSVKKVEKKYQRWANSYGIDANIVLAPFEEQAWDGTNRNRGIELARAKYIAFLDADDLYSEGMLNTFLRVFEKYECDAILHNYCLAQAELASDVEIGTDSLQNLIYDSSSTSLDFSTPILLELSDVIPQIHHAHLTVRKNSLAARYLGIFPGADTEFCKRLIQSGLSTVYIPDPISYWNRKRSIRYKVRLLKRKLL
ncbi:Glyco_tranf_GTA_type domain containing protein [Candidatus Nanopelagicaceae bacterium]